MHFDLIELLKTMGPFALWAIYGIIFAESGLFFGFFLPGDSLLFTAGFLASQNIFNIAWLAIGSFIAAVAGDTVGYLFGYHIGPRLFTREDSRFFHKNHLVKAQKFYESHGKSTIILARFVPVVRTFAPIVAGIGKMHYHTFIAYNIIGGLLWAGGMTIGGYYLGRLIPNVDRYLLPIVLVIVVLSVLPSLKHIFSKD